MVMIGRDLMIGNPKLAEMGYMEESCGHNAIAAGFQGSASGTDHMPNGDFMESILNSSFDWNGIREPCRHRHRERHAQRRGHALWQAADDTAAGFADVRTYWSPEAVERVTGWKPEGLAKDGFIHLINSGAVTLDASGQCEIDGKPAMKHWWDITPEEAAKCFDATQYCYGDLVYFRGGGYSSHLRTRGGMR